MDTVQPCVGFRMVTKLLSREQTWDNKVKHRCNRARMTVGLVGLVYLSTAHQVEGLRILSVWWSGRGRVWLSLVPKPRVGASVLGFVY